MADNPGTPPAVGEEAPDFTLEGYMDGAIRPVSLSDYRGQKHVVLAFYVLDWTGG